MKILYLANIRLPTEKAHGIQIVNTCSAFAKKGVEVELVVSKRNKTIPDDPFSYYGVEKNFSIKYVYCPELFFLGKLGFFLMNIWFSQLAAYQVLRSKPDIIYSRDHFLLFDLFLFPHKKIWEAHDGIWNVIIKATRLSGIVVISEGLKNYYSQKGIKNIVVAHDAVNLNQFTTNKKAELNLPPDKKIIMYIGHLYSWKGVETFLEASKLVRAHFIVIGGTEIEVAKLKKEYPHVQFTGYIPYSELPANQKCADILVVPNSAKSDISLYFTSPLKVFAHMTSGVPILASNIPSLREILNEHNAFFALPDNAESFAQTISYILSHESEAKNKAAVAREDVKKYTWDKRVEIIISFFATIQ